MEKLSITLTDEQARRIRERVDAGEYASASEVVRSALQQWERTEEAELDRRLGAIRKRLLAAQRNPIRHTSSAIREHIDDLVRAAESTEAKKRRVK